MPAVIDIIGKKYGRLLVLKYEGKSMWRCLCDCGNEKSVRSNSLKSSNTRSCGCLAVDTPTTHGRSRTPEHRCWISMNSRCSSETSPAYANYGGRGIRVCDRWRSSFESFYSDMGPRPSSDYSIDRIDNNGNYEPDNCRWTTHIEQCQNLRVNKYIYIDGEKITITEAARRFGKTRFVVFERIKTGMDPMMALTKPVRGYHRHA